MTREAPRITDPLLHSLFLEGGRRRRILAAIVGVGAFLAAIAALLWNRGTFLASLAMLSSAPPARILELLSGASGQLLASGFVLWWLQRRLVPVPLVDMSALVAASNAANFLPLRPGLVGRIAYLRMRHGVPLAISARVTLEAAGLSALVVVFFVLFLPLAGPSGLPGLAGFVGFTLAAAAATLPPRMRPYAIAAEVRLVEFGLLAWRYMLAFALVGREIDLDAAIAFTCIASAASMVPLFPNGMGIREWAIGLLAPAIAGHSLEEGIAAELVNRGAELVVTVLAGGPAAAWLARRPAPVSP